MIRFVILISAIVISLSGCIKEEDDILKKNCPGDCTVVRGRFTTAGGKQGVSNVPIELIWKNTGTLPLTGGTIRTKARTRTNADGYYELRFLIRKDELTAGHLEAMASVDKSKYLVYGNYMPYFYVPPRRDTTITADYLIPRKAFIDATLSNPSDVNLQNGDYFNIGFNSVWGLNASQRYGNHVSWYNRQLDEKFIVEVAADQQIIVEILKTKNKVRTEAYDTLLIPAGQTIQYRAEF